MDRYFADGRTDEERLLQLLKCPEQTHLDFKRSVDLEDPRQKLNFIKDAVAMSNTAPGGYIIVGVDDAGNPVKNVRCLEGDKPFDGAYLSQMIKKWVGVDVEVVRGLHEVDDAKVCLIYFRGHKSGIPVPMAKDGQYQNPDSGKTVSVFSTGQIFMRKGPKNTCLDREALNELIDDIVRPRALVDEGQSVTPKLSMGMSAEEFRKAVRSCLTASGDEHLQDFMDDAFDMSDDTEHFKPATLKTGIIAAQSMHFDNDALAKKAISYLTKILKPLGEDRADQQFFIAAIAYALGSLAVRQNKWPLLAEIVLQDAPRPYYPNIEIFWLRRALGDYGRAAFEAKTERQNVIDVATKLIQEAQYLAPDIRPLEMTQMGAGMCPDVIADSLCQFDVFRYMVEQSRRSSLPGPLPAAEAYRLRSEPAFRIVATDGKCRAQLFEGLDNKCVAQSIEYTFAAAQSQSRGYGEDWKSLREEVAEFVERYS